MKGQRIEPATSRAARRQRRGNGDIADWSGVDPVAIRGAIAAIGSIGGAIRFGYTRNGSAYAIGILGDGDPYTEYLRPSDNIEEYLVGLAEEFYSLSGTNPPA